ncbi:MAG: sulfatase [Planctomycetaceae bacterium]
MIAIRHANCSRYPTLNRALRLPPRTATIAVSLALAVMAVLPSAVPGASPPNIVFILTDDQRFDALGCLGNPVVRTPHIDALASQGVLFTNAFCTTSICAINRACLITGQWERRHRIDDFNTPLSSEQFAASFAGVLRQQGYRTGMVGKWGLGDPLPRDQYDVFEGYSGQGRYFPAGNDGLPGEHLTQKLGAKSLAFLDGCTSQQPFLLQLYTKAPHAADGAARPFPPDPRHESLYADAVIPVPATATEKHFRDLPVFLQNSEARTRWRVRFANAEMYQNTVKDYYRLVTGVDEVVGDVVAKLKEKGFAENTVIIFSSDNGFYLGEHGLAGKWFMHEESIRVPLIVYDPRLPERGRGRRVAHMVLSIDVAPTIIELANAGVPSVMQGKSLIPLLNGQQPGGWRDDFFYEHRFAHPGIPKTEGVRNSRWKYTRYISIDPVYEELFDLENDRHEEHNLAGDARYTERFNKLRSRCDELARQCE